MKNLLTMLFTVVVLAGCGAPQKPTAKLGTATNAFGLTLGARPPQQFDSNTNDFLIVDLPAEAKPFDSCYADLLEDRRIHSVTAEATVRDYEEKKNLIAALTEKYGLKSHNTLLSEVESFEFGTNVKLSINYGRTYYLEYRCEALDSAMWTKRDDEKKRKKSNQTEAFRKAL